MHNTVIFDIDGTLLNGTEGIIKSVKYTISKMNLHMISDKQLISFVGPPVQNSAKTIYKLGDEQAQQFANIFRQQYANGDVLLANIYHGIYDLLDYLKSNNYKLGVATYKRQDYARSLMHNFRFDNYFGSICGADNENKLKKSDIILNCLQELNSDINNAVMIGDSYHDAEAANKIGISFIGVTYGFGFKNKKEAEVYNPVFVADKPQEILEYIKKYKGE